jgi:hypothetical protein
MGITRFLKKSRISNEIETGNISIHLNEIIRNGSDVNDFKNFVINVNNQILDNEEKDELTTKKN